MWWWCRYARNFVVVDDGEVLVLRIQWDSLRFTQVEDSEIVERRKDVQYFVSKNWDKSYSRLGIYISPIKVCRHFGMIGGAKNRAAQMSLSYYVTYSAWNYYHLPLTAICKTVDVLKFPRYQIGYGTSDHRSTLTFNTDVTDFDHHLSLIWMWLP